MKRIILTLTVFIAGTLWLHAQCTTSHGPSGVTDAFPTTAIGQSFEVSCGGDLNSIGVITGGETNLTLTVYAGEGTAGSNLGSLNSINLGTSANDTDYQVVDVSSLGISLSASTRYTFYFNGTFTGTWRANPTNTYADGGLYMDGSAVPGDLLFEVGVLAPNTAPTVSLDNSTLAYTENAAATLIDPLGTVSDPDGDADWDGGTLSVQITANNEASDELSIDDQDADGTTITISAIDILANGTDVGDLNEAGGIVNNGAILTVTFDPDATNAIVQEVLQSFRYRNTSDDPSELDRTITVIATDNSIESTNDTRTVSVTAVNDAPTISGSASMTSILEDETNSSGTPIKSILTSLNATYTDPDGPGAGIAIVGVDETNGSWEYTTDGSVWNALTGVNINNALLLDSIGAVNAVRFVPNSDYNGNSGNISFHAWDISAGSDGSTGVDISTNGGATAYSSSAATASLTVTAVNDEPSFSLAGNVTVTENVGLQTVNGFASSISDGDGNTQSLTFNVSNDHASLFSTAPAINSTSGDLTFTPSAGKWGWATVTVSLSDNGGTANGGDNQSPDQTFKIFVTPDDIVINEADPTDTGGDPQVTGEFVELYSAVGGLEMDSLVLVLFNGSGSVSYKDEDLDGYFADANGYLVIGDAGVTNLDLDWGSTSLQNGSDAIALYVGNGSDFVNGDPVRLDGLVDVLVYGSADTDRSNLEAAFGGVTGVDEAANADAANESLGRNPNATGGFVAATPTPGAPNDNDYPTAVNIDTAVSVGNNALVINTAALKYSDTQPLQYIILSNVSVPSDSLFLDNGTLSNNGHREADEKILADGDTITKTELDAGYLTYVSTNAAGTEQFDFNVHDGFTPSLDSYTVTLYSVENALDFDGVDDFAYIPNNATLQPGTGGFTIEFWFKSNYSGTIPNQNKFLISNYGQGTSAGGNELDLYRFYFSADNQSLIFNLRDNAGNEDNLTSVQSNLLDDNWHHVAGVRDVTQGIIALYVDGIRSTIPLTAVGNIITDNDLILGGSEHPSGGPQDFWSGSLDEIKYWSSERSADEVRSNASMSMSNPVSVPSLELYLDMNVGKPGLTNNGYTVIPDRSASSINANLDASFGLSGTSSNWVASAAFSSSAATLGNVSVFDASDNPIADNATFSFKNIPYGTTTDTTFTIVNEGLGDLVLNVPALTHDTTYAFIAPYGAATNVAPNDSIDLTVRFAPDTAVNYTDVVTLGSNDADSPYVINLTGDGLDEVPPVFENSTPAVSAISASGFTLSVDLDEPGTIYYVVVADGDSPPDTAQVKAGNNASGSAAFASGSQAVSTGNFDHDFTVSGLTADTNYDIYVFAEDDENPANGAASPNGPTNVRTAGNGASVTAVASSEAGFFNSSTYNGASGSLTTSNAIKVFEFVVTDDAGDLLPTVVSSVDLKMYEGAVADLKAVGLYEGSSFIAEATFNPADSIATLNISGNLTITDGNTANVSVYVSLETAGDGQFGFTVDDVGQPGVGTSVIGTVNATSSTAGDENTVDNTPPQVNELVIYDTDVPGDGFIDRIDIVFSEIIDTDDGFAPVLLDLGNLLMPDSTQINSGVISDPDLSSNTVSITGITDQIAINTGAGETKIDNIDGLWKDRAGNLLTVAGDDSETVNDQAAPILASSFPPDNSQSFNPTADIVLVFSEDIQVGGSGTREIVLRKLTPSVTIVDTYNLSPLDTEVTIISDSVIINPAADLETLAEYSIQISADAIDELGNPTLSYDGISNNTDLNFIANNIQPQVCDAHDYRLDEESGNNYNGKLSPSACNNSPDSISSLATTEANAVSVFYFNILEGSTSTNSSNPTQINQITIENGNAVDWTRVFAGAQIIDQDGRSVNHTAINNNSIVFSGIPASNNGDLGYIVQNSDREYALRVWLRTDMPDSASIDNTEFSFQVNRGSFGTPNKGVERVLNASGTAFANSDNYVTSPNIVLDVDATQYGFAQHPTATEARQVMSPAVVVEAQDVNGNRDVDYVASETITVNTTGTSLQGTPQTSGTFSNGTSTVSDIIFSSTETSETLGTTGGSLANTVASDPFNITCDVTPPDVTASAIQITTTGSGPGEIFVIGDVITATYDNKTGGNKNNDIKHVEFDFSAFEGGSVIDATPSDSVYEASYTITAGTIDAGSNLNVTVIVHDDADAAAGCAVSNNASAVGGDNEAMDNKRPEISVFNPLDDATGVATNSDIVLTFSEDVTASFGEISMVGTVASNLQSFTADNSSVVSISNNVVTISAPNAFAGSETYDMFIDTNSFLDANGNAFGGISSAGVYNFTTDVDDVGPELTITIEEPTNGSTSVTSDNKLTFNLAFNEEVVNFNKFRIGITEDLASTPSFSISQVNSKTYRVQVDNLVGDGTVQFTVDNGPGSNPTDTIKDAAGNKFIGPENSSIITIDQTAPVLTVNALSTNDASPALTGTIQENLTVLVTLNGKTDTAVVSGTGPYTWEVPDNTIDDLVTEGNYTIQATATDAAGNQGIATNNLRFDQTPPQISGVYFFDTEATPDGNIDEVLIIFTEAIEDATVDVNDFVFSGASSASVASVIDHRFAASDDPDDSWVTFDLVGYTGTATSNVDYIQPSSGGLADLVGNLLDTAETNTEIDYADPLVKTTHQYDTDGDGDLDEIVIEFTEGVRYVSADVSSYNVVGSSSTSFVSHTTASNIKDQGSLDEFLTLSVDVSGTDTTRVDYDASTPTKDASTRSNNAPAYADIPALDLAVPVVTGVSSAHSDPDTLIIGESIVIDVTFSEDVDVTGIPTLTLETGATDEVLNYSSGTGTSVLSFNYTVQAGNESDHLDYVATNSLVINPSSSITIEDQSANTNEADVSLPSPGAAASLSGNKQLRVDGVVPTIVRAGQFDTNGDGYLDEIVLEFSEGVSPNTIDVNDFILDGGAETVLGVFTWDNAAFDDDLSDTDIYVTLDVYIEGTDTVSVAYDASAGADTVVTDLAGNPAANDSYIEPIDLASPVFLAAYFFDTDSDGDVDEIAFQFSEEIDETTVEESDFTLADGSIIGLALNDDGGFDYVQNILDATDEDEYATLEVLIDGTYPAEITYNRFAGGADEITDMADNDAPNDNGIFHVDAAPPLLLNAYQLDVNDNGHIDEIVIELSEPQTSGGVAADFTVNGVTPDNVLNVRSSNGLDLTATDEFITILDSVVGTAVAQIAYLGSGSIEDEDSNAALGNADINAVDGAVPQVMAVTSSVANGLYKNGDVIGIKIALSEDVEVNTGSGTPTIRLETGNTDQSVAFTSVTGDTLLFNYTVEVGDNSADLNYTGTGALLLNGGVIQDTSGNNANITLPGLVSANSLGTLKDLEIDGVLPEILTAYQFDTDANGDIDEIVLELSEEVDENSVTISNFGIGGSGSSINGVLLSGPANNTLDANDADEYVTLDVSVSGTSLVTLSYNNGPFTLADVAGNIAPSDVSLTTSDEAPPVVMEVTSSVADTAYNAGDVIPIIVNFSEFVTVDESGGKPILNLATGGAGQNVNLTSGSGTSSLTFNYTVQPGNNSLDLNYSNTSSLTLPGVSTIKDQSANGNDALLTLPGIAADSSLAGSKNIVIDTDNPAITTLTISNGTFKGVDPHNSGGDTADDIVISMDFNDDLGSAPSVIMRSGGFFMKNAIDVAKVGGLNDQWTATITVDRDDVNGPVTFEINYQDKAGNSGTELTEADAVGAAVIDNTNPIVTFSVVDNPTNEDPFTVSAQFSEGIEDLALGDLSIVGGNGSISNLTATSAAGDEYTFIVDPDNNQTATVIVRMADEGVVDSVGNTIQTTDFTINFDDVAPILTYSSTLFGRDLTVNVSQSEKGVIYYALVPDGTSVDSLEVQGEARTGGVITGAIQADSVIATAGVTYLIELTLPADTTDYDFYLVSQDEINPDYNLSAPELINVKSGGVLVTAPYITDVCLEGDYYALGDIVITESIPTDFVGSNANRNLRLELPDIDGDGIADFEFNTSTGSVTDNGGDVSAIGISYVGTSVLSVTYNNANSTSALDVLTISGIQIAATGASAQLDTLKRSGGNGNIYLANDGDGTVFARFETVAPYDKLSIVTSEPATFSAPYLFENDSTVRGDVRGNDVVVYDKREVETTNTPFVIGLPSLGDEVTIYSDASLSTQVANYVAISTEDRYIPTLLDLGLVTPTDTLAGINTFWVTTTDGNSCESEAIKYSVAIIRYENSEGKTGFAVNNSSGTTLKFSNPADHSVIVTGNGLTGFQADDDFTEPVEDGYSFKFIPSAAGQGFTTVSYQLTNSEGVAASYEVEFLVIESDRVLSAGQDLNYCNYDQAVTFNVVSPFGIDHADVADDSDPDFKTIRVYLYDSINSTRGTEVTSTVLTSIPAKVAGQPNDTTGWVFDPGTLDSELASKYGQALLFVYVIEDENTGNETELAEEVVDIYRTPTVSITNVDPYYCNDGSAVTIESQVISAEGTETLTLSDYYRISVGVDTTAVSGANFDPSNLSFGDYRLMYISPERTEANCLDTAYVNLEILEKPAVPTLSLTGYDLIGGQESGSDNYLFEYAEGESVLDITAEFAGGTPDDQMLEWYSDPLGQVQISTNVEGTSVTAYGETFNKSETLKAQDQLFGGSTPAGRTNKTVYLAQYDYVKLNGADYEGCRSDIIKIDVKSYAIPDQPSVDISTISSSNPREVEDSDNLGLDDGAYVYEYCADAGTEASVRDIVMSTGLSTEANEESYWTIYDSDGSTAIKTFTVNTIDVTVDSLLNFAPLADSSKTFYISRTDFDNDVNNNPNILADPPFNGVESEKRPFKISVHAFPDALEVYDLSDAYDNAGVATYYRCFGDELPDLRPPGAAGTIYQWYKDDGSGNPDYANPIAVAGNDGRSATQVELEAAYATDTFDTPGTYVYYITQRTDRNEASGFLGCESDPLKIEIKTYEDPKNLTFDDSGAQELEVSYCVGDLGDVKFPITGNPNSKFVYYSASASKVKTSSAVSLFGGEIDADGNADVTAAALLITNAGQGTYHFLVSQINNVNPDGAEDRSGNTFEGCESELEDMAFLTVHVYDIPVSPTTSTVQYFYCEGDPIADITVNGEVGARYNWWDEDNNLVYDETPTGNSSVATAADLGLTAAGDYTFKVTQTQDIGAGVATFEGCTSDFVEINVTIYEVPVGPVVEEVAPQCNVDVTTTSTVIRYSGVSTPAGTTSSFKFLDADLNEQQEVTASDPTDVSTFNISAVKGMVDDGFIGDTTIYVQQITYTQSGFEGCSSPATPVTITVEPIPVFARGGEITKIQACDNGQMVIEVELANLLVDSADFTWKGGRTEAEAAANVINGNQMKISDRVVQYSFSASSFEPGNNYFIVEVSDKNRPDGLQGCVASTGQEIEIGTTPQPKFRWSGITEGNPTTFQFADNNNTTSNTYRIDSVTLEIPALGVIQGLTKSELSVTRSNIGSMEYTFANAGTYEVQVTFLSNSLCDSTVTRFVTILDHIVWSGDIAYDFESGASGWVVDSLVYSTSDAELGYSNRTDLAWQVGTEDVDYSVGADQEVGINASQYWATGLGTSYLADEDAWVLSPSFDLSAMEQPTIGFDFAADLAFTDGVAVQYTLDDGATWKLLGDYDASTATASGKNWYTTEQLNKAPGIQQFNVTADGWSDDSPWVIAAHRINEPIENLGQIRFRFALASTAGTKEDQQGNALNGFAFDNFTIYNKDKFVLIEQFSELGDARSIAANDSISSRVNSEIERDAIWLNYYPRLSDVEDPISQRNLGDPGARSVYYGVDQGPTTVLTGKTVFNAANTAESQQPGWNVNQYNGISLDAALFEIGDINISGDPYTVNISTSFTSKVKLPAGSEVSFRFAIIEREITDQSILDLNGGKPLYNVLRKMLPSSGGLTYVGAVSEGQSVFFGDSEEVSVSWEVSDVFDPGQLAVVVFVQVDNTTSELPEVRNRLILQSGYAEITGKELPTVTSVANRLDNIDNFTIYPNPANKRFSVQFEKSPGQSMKWVLYDQVGREALFGFVKPGELEIEITSKELPSGVYMIHFFSDDEQWQPQRLIIVH
ncbi:Ig-like domain-containing protein [Marinoscillum furvescens]|uniref:Ig-like domain-containing protein n=1 Tax=Marinoscillum furvescens DSM 4134 TaxID=1122208 RepID=A0A3D9L9G7_MARFU|nr:Ig-like domain-containing protein [Marinoscillum furvescens]REE02117.1 Ig-like domain-containing protein [Marinoscillum furvescens DSM 4134]